MDALLVPEPALTALGAANPFSSTETPTEWVWPRCNVTPDLPPPGSWSIGLRRWGLVCPELWGRDCSGRESAEL